MQKKGSIGFVLLLCSALLTGCASTDNSQIPFTDSNSISCVPRSTIIKLVESIPKKFPMGKKDNVFIITSENNGNLTATIDGLIISYFDSRNPDLKKWGTVTNKLVEYGLEGDMEKIGCVTAGINNYDTGKVDMSENSVRNAQLLFNQYTDLTLELLDK